MKTLALAGLASVFLVLPSQAQDRMPPIPADQMSPAQKKVADAIMSGPRRSTMWTMRRIEPRSGSSANKA